MIDHVYVYVHALCVVACDYLNVTIICGYIFLRILDSKHVTGIKFCILFWARSNLMIFIVVSPTKKYLRILVFTVLEQITEISNISTRKNL